jgi:hypothetical protein
MENLIENKYAKLSLISVTLTLMITSAHHIYELGPRLLILVPLLIMMLLPSVFMLWFKHTRHKVALLAYGLFNAFVITGFGITDGLLDHTFKVVGSYIGASLPGGSEKVVGFSFLSPIAGDFFFEGTGILTFIASMFVAYYGYKFIQAEIRSWLTWRSIPKKQGL